MNDSIFEDLRGTTTAKLKEMVDKKEKEIQKTWGNEDLEDQRILLEIHVDLLENELKRRELLKELRAQKKL